MNRWRFIPGAAPHWIMAIGELVEARLTHSVIGAFYEVYNRIGFGFLESLYGAALERELRQRGHHVGREVHVRIFYNGDLIGRHRIDMIVDQKPIVEMKSTFDLHRAAARQVYNYLRATRLEVALLLHFGSKPKMQRFVWRTDQAEPRTPDPIDPFRSGVSR